MPRLQGYLAHKKQPHPLGPPYDPRYSPTVGSQVWEEVLVSEVPLQRSFSKAKEEKGLQAKKAQVWRCQTIGVKRGKYLLPRTR